MRPLQDQTEPGGPHCRTFQALGTGEALGSQPCPSSPTVLWEARWGQTRNLSGRAEAWVGPVQTKHSLIPACTEGPAKRKSQDQGRVGGRGFPGPTDLSRKLARALPVS